MREKILIALSDINLVTTITEHLVAEGYVPEKVTNGKDVVNKLRQFRPDLLLIDTVLPDKSGYDVLTEKSFDKDTTKIPVIIISNTGDPIQMKKIPSNPTIKDYIIKTHIDPEEVIEKIEKAFGRSSITEVNTPKSQVAGGGKKILWVEDDKMLSNILSKKFESSGYTLLKAKNGDEAFEFLQSNMPDIIVLDIMLPGMSGMDILQKIKMDMNFNTIPVIMLSNLNKQSDLDKAKLLGADKFMVKAAVSLDEIIREIDSMIKNKQ